MSNENKEIDNVQENAREFWRLAGSNFAPHYYVYSQLLEYQTTYGATDIAQYQAKVTELLTNIGYGTSMDAISAQFTAGKDSEIGYYAGTYHLFDTEGQCYTLTVSYDDAILMLPTTALDLNQVKSPEDFAKLAKLISTDFQQGILTLTNPQYTFTLQFILPHSEEKISDETVDITSLTNMTQTRCIGTVAIKENNTVRELKLQGKRGSYTLAGIEQEGDGDPINTWVGRYMVVDVTNPEQFQQSKDVLEIAVNNEELTLQWGKEIVGEEIQFNNNALAFIDDGEPVNRYMLQFSLQQDGRKQFVMASVEEGFSVNPERKFIGYWLDNPATIKKTPLLHSSTPHSSTLLAHSSVTLKLGATEVSLPEQTIDIGTGSAINETLPIGVPSNPYKINLKLSNIPKNNVQQTVQYDWALPATFTKGTITANADPSSAVLDLTWATSDVGSQKVIITLTPKSSSLGAETKTLTLTISVQALPVITISPTGVLPPITRGNEYTVSLSANGGTGLYTWEEAAESKLPPGIKFDPKTQILNGKVSDLKASQDTFSLKVKISARGALMTPGQFTISLQVQEPGQEIAREIGYAVIALTIIGSLIMLVSFPKKIYDDVKSIDKNRGDPTFEKKYIRTNLIGNALKTSLDGLGAKRFTHHIEEAIQFDSKYAEWLKKNQREPAIKRYSTLIDQMNTRLNTLQKDLNSYKQKLAEEQKKPLRQQDLIKQAGYKRAIETYEAREALEKVRLANDLAQLGKDITTEHQQAKTEKQNKKREGYINRAREWMRR